ncbi:MAG: hypothetical protein SFU53_07090 [Terrimicrobiaceae bacterium]|nr:hypothetical protein [Terrimicrobiaceae bacterium]
MRPSIFFARPTVKMLVPCDIVPDWNRDGVIDNKDRGKVTEEKPWRFWCNDDDDEGDVGGANDNNSDVPGAGVDNGADLVVNGIRDLVDFFPLWLDIKQMLEVLSRDQFDYVLESENNSLQYAETTLTKEDSDAYLKAELGEVSKRNNPKGLARVAVKTIAQGQAKLSDEFLQSIIDETGGVLLIEAWKATDKPLKLVVKRKSSGEQMCEFPFHLKIDDVEKMFRHKNIRQAVPAWAGRVPGEADRLGEPENYPDDVCINKNFIFVHGYNVNGDQARGWHAEVFKRLFWSGNRAKFYGVSWSGDRGQYPYPVLGLRTPSFHRSVADAFASASALSQFVGSIQGETTIAAHSLGNLMTSVAQSDFGMSVTNFYMVNAAQSLEQYQANAARSSRLTQGDWRDYQEREWPSEWHQLFAQEDSRRLLTWRGRVAAHSGSRYNFYSDVSNGLGDHVMESPPDSTGSGWEDLIIQANAAWGATSQNNPFIGAAEDGRQAFCLQERLKGRFLYPSMGSSYGGWRFTANYQKPPSITFGTPTPEEAAQLSTDALRLTPVFDPGFTYNTSPPYPHQPATEQVRSGAPSWIADLTKLTTGSAIAEQHRSFLLSEMFPARTLAVGGNPVPAFGSRNIDMQSTMRLGWPASRLGGDPRPRWLHGDMKDVGYTYVFPLFDEWVELGQLK